MTSALDRLLDQTEAPEWVRDPPDTSTAAEIEPLRPFRRRQLDLTAQPEPVVILLGWLYPGSLTVLQSEPGVGKSWIAAWLAVQLIALGRPVVYLDEEGGPDLITERLVALGADPDAVDRLFYYFAFEARRWHDEDLIALDDLIARVPGCALAVLDSLPDHLAQGGMSEDSATDVTAFFDTVCRRFQKAGIAPLALDHLIKPPTDGKTKRSRYSRGSGAKLAKADVTLLLETVDEFDANTSGRLRVWKTKDRRGRLPIPWLAKPPLELAVDVDPATGNVTIRPDQAVPDAAAWDGPRACMDAVLAVLADAGIELSGNALIGNMRAAGRTFRERTVREAADRLVIEGAVSVRTGRRSSRMYTYRPPESGQEEPLDEDF